MMNHVVDALVLGTGFAGLCSAIKLKEAGMSFVVLEKDCGVGGVWRANTYPGAQCDVQSHLYSFSFEQYPYWSRSYGLQTEILSYLEMCVEKYDLLPYIHFNTSVMEVRWNESENIWEIKTNRGKVFQAKTFFLASGGLSQPLYPDIQGMNTFKGKLFHSAAWDHSVDLSEKKVGIIGSAASAIQIVPAIAPIVKRLSIFQRTASWVLPKADYPYSAMERWMFHILPPLQWASRELIYWKLEWRVMAFVHAPFLLELVQGMVKQYIQRTISDKVLAEKVTPNYTMGCKRVLLSNDYYPAIQRPNVDVITEGIQSIHENGIILKDGSSLDLDIIVLATGFHVTEGVVPFDIYGKNGKSLNEEWKDGMEAYLGTSIKGFPNLLMIVGPNTGLGHSSMVYMIEAQVDYAMKVMKYMKQEKVKSIEVKQEVQNLYNKEIQKKLDKSVWNTGGCSSWYKNKKGKNTSLWPGFTFEFRNRTSFFRQSDYLVKKEE
jgi:cation diffusion facilitator CzcD-associated flavoprotein CzcO